MDAPTHFMVRNWQQFQHYKDRNPPWIKLHFALLSSEDWVMLDDASRLLAVVCMLVASRNDGRVPNNPAYVKRVAFLDAAPDFTPLISCGFLQPAQACASDPQAEASTPQAVARPRRGEERQSRDLSVARTSQDKALQRGAASPHGKVNGHRFDEREDGL